MKYPLLLLFLSSLHIALGETPKSCNDVILEKIRHYASSVISFGRVNQEKLSVVLSDIIDRKLLKSKDERKRFNLVFETCDGYNFNNITQGSLEYIKNKSFSKFVDSVFKHEASLFLEKSEFTMPSEVAIVGNFLNKLNNDNNSKIGTSLAGVISYILGGGKLFMFSQLLSLKHTQALNKACVISHNLFNNAASKHYAIQLLQTNEFQQLLCQELTAYTTNYLIENNLKVDYITKLITKNYSYGINCDILSSIDSLQNDEDLALSHALIALFLIS